MTANFFKRLYLGKQLTDEEYEDIPHYRAELHYHVLNKNLQMASILGMGIVGPLIGLIKGRSFASVRQYSNKTGKIMAMVLLPAAPVMTEFFIRNATEEAIYDRSYRIRHNDGQMRTDRIAGFCGAVGAPLGVVNNVGIVPGLMLGVAVGTVSSGLYGRFLAKQRQA